MQRCINKFLLLLLLLLTDIRYTDHQKTEKRRSSLIFMNFRLPVWSVPNGDRVEFDTLDLST